MFIVCKLWIYAAGKNELLDYIIKLNLNIFAVLSNNFALSKLFMINLKL